MAPKLYMIPGSSAARAVLNTAKLIGLELELHEVDMGNGEHLSPEYLKINPQHTVPTLDDNGNIIWDSHAINAYLVGKYAKDDSLYPKDLYKRAVIDQRFHFDTGMIYNQLRIIAYAFMRKEIKELTPKMIEEVNEAYAILEKLLEGKQWVALDHLTLADLSLMPSVSSCDVYVKIDPKKYPNIINWIKRVQAIPGLEDDAQRHKAFVGFVQWIRAGM